MWNGSVRLIRHKQNGQNANGFAETVPVYSESIPASIADVTRNDEVLASQKGYTADRNIEIMACNYHGERQLMDEADGRIYDIRRTYKNHKSMKLILTCEMRDCSGEFYDTRS